jgi:hypothetical protein
MRSKAVTIIIVVFFLVISGCAKQEEINPTNTVTEEVPPQDQVLNEVIYYGKGDNWLATCSLFMVNTSLFESIYIQYIGENSDSEVGPIEYELVGSEYKSSSSYPQELQGVGSFQVSTKFNTDLFSLKPTGDGTYKLTIKSNLNTEVLSLSKISK